MRKAVAFALLLLTMAAEVRGAKDEARAQNPNSAHTKEAEKSDGLPADSSSSSGFSGNLLVVPMDGSHWVGIKAIAQEMGRRGHRVTVVIPEISIRMGPGKYYDTIAFPVPYDEAYLDYVMSSHKDIMEKIRKRYTQVQRIAGFIHTTAESLLFNSSLISHLAQQVISLFLGSLCLSTCTFLSCHWLSLPGIPTVNLLRGTPCSADMKAAGCPSPASFVPRSFTGYTDRMNFKERVINTLVAVLEPLFCRLMFWHFDHIASEFLEEEVGIMEVLSDSDIWLLRIDFTLELPRPLMPNMVLVGGINCNVRNPLPDDLEEWVSGQHGFIVFTLGSMVSDLPEDITSVFLDAFGQIPQKVIWRYTGRVSENVPSNVKMMKWVPQNDLLAHRGVRAFITHAGSHGVFEGLCHGVPMLMVPLNADQPDNALKIAQRGAGLVLDITSLTTESLLQGLTEIINTTRYKENVQKLAALHNDRPVDPLDLSVYWTEYVMKHKGAKHLKAAVRDLHWFQYFCLDVITFLAATVLLSVTLTVKCLKFCFGKLNRKKKQA
ncbi:UDP-glucuronosyltransferase 1A1-like [Nematolebias whitei]|uniref:UDP-glucuronosyltransferase 1A1-like n=1 Tax=Nematolebias whitei TaxID=451745 RepID=UPI00189B0868|nr:UDP-glucuronosyltransferase 1A1-like [Nematolebias whitei]